MTEFASSIHLATLGGDTGFRIEGKTGSSIGFAVSNAGDVNGDGFADLIVGADRASPNGAASGASYVVFGASSGFPIVPFALSLAVLIGARGFEIGGEAAGDRSGNAVSSAGDVNGDGIDDVIIGAPGAGPNGSARGASYVVFGRTTGFAANLDLAGLNGAKGFEIRGEAAGGFAGRSVSGAGDVNGDGFDDLIIGAYRAYPNGGYSGASYVVFGKAERFPANFNLAWLNGANGFEIRGEAAGDSSGYSVSGAGDVNGDGFADLLIGAKGASPKGDRSGASYVVFGKAQAFAATLELSALDGTNGFEIRGEAAYDYSGFSVSGAGDVNGDGFADLIVGAYRADPHGDGSGASYVVFGRSAGFTANLDLSALNGTTGFEIGGESGGDYSGFSVADAGDVNGDGFGDLIVGARSAGPGGGGSGASYVVFGKAAGFTAVLDLSTLDGNNGFEIVGTVGTLSGQSVSGAGDVNGDGFDDLAVGAPSAFPNGAAYVMFGHRALTAVTRTGTNIAQTINGGMGNDRLDGLRGFDTLVGWEGNDVYTLADLTDFHGGLRFDLISEASDGGRDAVRVASLNNTNGGDGYQLTPHVENAVITGGRDFFVVGNAEGNVMIGNVANNSLVGFGGDDRLFGRFGNDVLTGGRGQDGLVGGQESDRFVFNALAESGRTEATRDVIVDFTHLADVIDLSKIDARPVGSGDSFVFRGVAAFTDVGQVRLQQFGAYTLVELNTTGGVSAEATIELNGVTASTLSAADFVL